MKEEKEKTEKKEVVKPPVVVVLGHIDHGKTSILDFIRKTHIVEKEAGGITQHIGAYEVEHLSASSGQVQKITFIDTPGHEAFSAMRGRGAKVADIAILVVDATEGVKAQTKEAINFAKMSQLPIIVALNKIDKPQAQPEKAKKELADSGVLVESLAGKIPSINVSAKTGQGIDELLETILLVAEIEDLKTDIASPVEGTVIESSLHHQEGPVATLILEKGILKENDILGTASTFGKIKRLRSFQGEPLKEAHPSQPVLILGFERVPKVGEKFKVFPDFESAQAGIKKEIDKSVRERRPAVALATAGKEKVLNIILKTDVLGSLEAIEDVLRNIPQDEVVLRVLKAEVGKIGVSDIKLAESSRAKIFAFRTKLDESAQRYLQQKKVFSKFFELIYELVEEVRKEMEKLLTPEIKRVDLGKIKILVLFKKEKSRQIIGGRVIEGEITRDKLVEVLREGRVVGKGRIKNIQQEKKDIPLAGKGKEIGILFEGETEIKEGDILAVFKTEREKRTL
ncbi:MAG: translation initiation factor IF-2 [Patescibacteria group bacterium]|nr:translation initiation factor IF-2 [Patescibacteria group bacterium]